MIFGQQKYRLGERIGGGSFGEIYEVRNLKTGEDCAAKEELIKYPSRRRSHEEQPENSPAHIEGIPLCFLLSWKKTISNVTLLKVLLLKSTMIRIIGTMTKKIR